MGYGPRPRGKFSHSGNSGNSWAEEPAWKVSFPVVILNLHPTQLQGGYYWSKGSFLDKNGPLIHSGRTQCSCAAPSAAVASVECPCECVGLCVRVREECECGGVRVKVRGSGSVSVSGVGACQLWLGV